MKPTSMLKKIGIAGMLASCIFLVNCSQAKDDTKTKLAEKLALENMLPSCSDEVMQLLKQRSTLFGSIREILAGPLDDAQKLKLQTFIDEIYNKSTAIMTKVRSSKVAGFPATGCSFKENEAEIKYQLSVIKTEDLALAKRVSEANDKKQNEILKNTRPVWKAGDKLTPSSELAEFLSNETFINGKRIIHHGKVANGGRDFLFLKSKTSESICVSVTLDGQGFTSEDTLEIVNVTPRLDNTSRIIQDLSLFANSISGKRSLLLSCILPDGSDLNDAMVDTFGNLLVKQEPPQ